MAMLARSIRVATSEPRSNLRRKERLIMTEKGSDDESGKPILVIGADATQFDEVTLGDPRVRLWGADEIREGASIPEGTEKIICCSPSIGRRKALMFQRIAQEERAAGRTVRIWDVPHQGRLREVLGNELKYSSAKPEDERVQQTEAAVVRESEEESVVVVVVEEELNAPKPQPVPAEVQSEAETVVDVVVEKSEEGEKLEMLKKTPIMRKSEIVRVHLEETGGDADKLLAILRKSGYPDAKKHDVYNMVYNARKVEEATGGRKASAKAEPKTSAQRANGPDKTPAPVATNSTFAVRFAAALAKITEGQAELKVLLTEAPELEKMADGYRTVAKLFGGGEVTA
jgi:hypothetical protein